MKTLKESLFDQEDISSTDVEKSYIQNWLDKYYKIDEQPYIDINNKQIRFVREPVIVLKKFTDRLLPEGWTFTKAKNFNCICPDLISLEGSPDYVSGIFVCGTCKKLKSLKGAPRHCDHLICSKTSIETFGIPECRCRVLTCTMCDNIKSFEGAPFGMNEVYSAYCPNLETLKGLPNNLNILEVSGTGLKNLKHMPTIREELVITDMKKDFDLSGLKQAPKNAKVVIRYDNEELLKFDDTVKKLGYSIEKY